MTKLPYIQFYQGDWKKDLGVQCVSFAARGLWVEMLFLMQDSTERGVLVDAHNRPLAESNICRLCGAFPEEFERLLSELEDAKVFSRRDDGAIFSRRMVRDEEARKQNAENGKKGGRPSRVSGNLSSENPTNTPPVSVSLSKNITETQTLIGDGVGSDNSLTNTDTATGTREGGAGGNQSRSSSPIPIRGGLAAQERFDDFYVAYCEQTGKPVTEKDRLDALEHWREMPFSEKLEAVRHIPQYVADYRPDNPRRYKTPVNYLKSRIWTEVSLKPAAKEPKGVRLEDIA